MRHTVIVKRPVMVDDGRGNTVVDFTDATSTPSDGWAIDAGNTTEDNDGRDSDTAEYTIRGPFTADVLPFDHVLMLGLPEMEIVGAIMRQPGPTSLTSHTILQLKQVDG
jgi:hypothetical protein